MARQGVRESTFQAEGRVYAKAPRWEGGIGIRVGVGGGGVESAKIGVWRGDQSRARPPRIHGEDVDLDLENRAHCRRLNLM